MSKKSKNSDNEKDDSLVSFLDHLSTDAKRGLITVFLFSLAILTALSLFGAAGQVGQFISETLASFFGWSRYVMPLVLMALGVILFFDRKFNWHAMNFVGVALFVASFNALMHLMVGGGDQAWSAVVEGRGGGYLGLVLAYPLDKYLGLLGALVVLFTIFITSIILIFNKSIQAIILKTKEGQDEIMDKLALKAKEIKMAAGSDEKDEPEKPEAVPVVKMKAKEKEEGEAHAEPAGDAIVITAKKFRKVDLPLDLLDNKITKPSGGDIRANQYVIKKTLENFNIPVEMSDFAVGPTVTQYTFKPADGVKLNRITGLSNDLALALAAHPIRIEAPIPGKSLVGIEVPNHSIAVVRLHEIMESKNFKTRKSNLSIGLGKDVSGEVWVADIARMPHLLVAGATGSGKSVYLNSLILSLLYQNSPGELKFIMVDPKRVELTVYNTVPHLLTPVITDVKKTINALKWLIGEMDRRYDTLSKVGHRNIASYNAVTEEKMPYIMLVVDELADLMVTAAAEIEGSIIRLAQMARAVGIHLILATQRPSVDVITGLIKANITTRIAFSVPSLMDSRTILDTAGAEKLVGRGDMLYVSAELSKPKRLQGAFVSDEEIKRVVDYLAKEVGAPQFVEEVVTKPAAGSLTSWDVGEGDDDALLEDAKREVVRAGKASASFLQRRLKVGYARAARLLDLLEEQGVIGPGDGAKPRDILVNSYEVSAEDMDPVTGDSAALAPSEDASVEEA